MRIGVASIICNVSCWQYMWRYQARLPMLFAGVAALARPDVRPGARVYEAY